MPELSRFFGIVIRMFYSDHEPAHFHAIYGEYQVLIEIETLSVFRGELPRRAIALVLDGLRSIVLSFARIGGPLAMGKLSKRSSLSIEVTPLWRFCGFARPNGADLVRMF
jgi:hypothetical protein